MLLARATDQPLEDFLRERLFEPLGMADTGFSVPPAKLDRLVSGYQSDPETGSPVLHEGVDDSHWSRPQPFPDGGAGLVSTVDDYLAFRQMLLNRGRHGNERILSRPAVEAMITNQLSPAQQTAGRDFLGRNRSWGFGLSVVTRRDGIAEVPGRFGWDGGYGTSWASDPADDLVGILMTQRMAGPEPPTISSDFWTSVYQAIDD